MDVARRVAVTSAGSSETTKTFTIYGTNRDGIAISEAIAGPGASATVYTSLDFKTVTRVAVSAATAGAVTVGTNSIGSTQWFQRDWVNNSRLGVLVYITGTVNVTIEGTIDDPNQPLDAPPYYATPVAQSSVPPVAAPFDGWVGLSASKFAEITCPCFMFRMTVNSGTDAAMMKVVESTPWSRAGA